MLIQILEVSNTYIFFATLKTFILFLYVSHSNAVMDSVLQHTYHLQLQHVPSCL